MTILIPERDIDLEKLGLINQELFEVDGELAQRYNQVLLKVFGYENEMDSFRIDKRGLSPELSVHLKAKFPDKLEYGENYLNIGSANRFMVVLSPDQKSSPLVFPQSSYENGLIDNVYRAARHTIEEITTSEALYGELENGITLFRSVKDLLQYRTVKVSLDTLAGTSNALSELTELSDRLGEDDNALNPEYISKMRELVEKVGKISSRSISDIFPVKVEVHCFQVGFYNGVYCLRNFKNKDDIKGIFITNNQGKLRDLSDEILALDLHDKEVLKTLHKYGFMKYDSRIVSQRIDEVADNVLLSRGLDVVSLTPHERKREIVKKTTNLPKSWHQLNDIKTALENTSDEIEDIIDKMDYETKLKLSVPASKKEILNNLLAELDPTDPVRMYEFNLGKFRREFPTFTLNRQRYIVKRILEMKGGND
ncbi:hypothetical protein HY450_02575 [Candidatus Pacearchaeota archaeon]|nr:hypothetical protein [Candidatus Pacearchaeota archaeon]